MTTLKSIPLGSIDELEPKAIADLKYAATQQGFFYLDLRQQERSHVLSDVNECIDLAVELYSSELDEKLVFDIDKLGSHKLNGYKPAGRNAGAQTGKQDGFEAYLLPRDGICNSSTRENGHIQPAVLQQHKKLLQRIMDDLHAIGQIVLRALTIIVDQNDFGNRHRPEKPSTSALGLLKYPQLLEESDMVGHSAHTDVGSLTLLFCTGPGLQFLNPLTDQWTAIEALDGQAIVNIGDSLRFLSGSLFQSCLHRVIPPPLHNGATDRYSLAYFMRPELSARFRDDNGKEWASINWHDNKYKIFRAPLEEQKCDCASQVLTGKAGYLGLWEPAGTNGHS